MCTYVYDFAYTYVNQVQNIFAHGVHQDPEYQKSMSFFLMCKFYLSLF